jgi:diacylglycerol kinase family enzyme
VGNASSSPHAFTTKAHSVRIQLDRKVLYEIDGGDRKKVRKLRIDVDPEAIQICVPAPTEA